MSDDIRKEEERSRRDPLIDEQTDSLRKEPDSHTVGTSVGAVGGGAAGAAIGGAVGGPLGATIGGVAGAVAGGLTGDAAARAVDPTVEDAFWRENYASRPYAVADRPYEHYRPAYRYGWESRVRYADRKWDEVEPELERGWDSARGESRLTWQDAKQAVRDAWHRIERAMPGDADRDRR